LIKYFVLIILLISSSNASQYNLGETALKAGDIQKALVHYKKAVSREDEDAMFKLGLFYYKGQYVKKDLEKAFNYFKQASKLGHQKAQYNLALLYARKDSSFHNYRLAYNIFLDLAKQSHAKAQYQVGNFLTYGFVDKDYKLAVQWYEQALKNGSKLAGCSLAYMYTHGKGVFVNLGKARELAQDGYDSKIPLCMKVYKEFNLHKYDRDRGFKL